MTKLTIQAAEDFHDSCMKRIVDNDFRLMIQSHSISVGRLAIILSKGQFGEEIYFIAGLVHDIGFSVEKEGHAKHSLALLKEEGFDISPELEDCILNHGSKVTTKTLVGKYFQLADKLSMFEPALMSEWIKKFDNPFSREFKEFIHKKVNKIDVLFEE